MTTAERIARLTARGWRATEIAAALNMDAAALHDYLAGRRGSPPTAGSGEGGAGSAEELAFTPTGDVTADNVQDAIAQAAQLPPAAQSGSGLPANVVSRTTGYTATAGDIILANATSGVLTITLPTGPATGGLVTVIKTDASVNAVNVAGTVNGDAGGLVLGGEGVGAILEHVGSNLWWVVADALAVGDVTAADVTFTPAAGLTSTDVQAAIAEVAGLISSGGTTVSINGSAQAAVDLVTDAATIRTAIGVDTPTDTRTPTDGSVTAAKVNAALKPSGTAVAGTEALRAIGTTASTAAAGNDARLSDTRTPTDATVTIAKLATGVLDTDTTLAANSDSKIASQKAVKAYVAANAGGASGRAGTYATGRYYTIAHEGAAKTNTQFVNGRLYVVPFYVEEAHTFDRITIEVISAAGSAGSVVRMGIYDNSAGYPSSLILDAGTVATTSIAVASITISQALTVGWKWLALAAQAAPATDPTLVALGPDLQGQYISPIGNSSGAFANTQVSYMATAQTGALPGTFPAAQGSQADAPMIHLRA